MDDEHNSSEQPAATGEHMAPQASEQPEKSHLMKMHATSKSHLSRFKTFYLSHKRWSIPTTVIVLLAILAAIPFTRFALAGTVLKQTYVVSVIDATTKQPVSSAAVSLGSAYATTDKDGKASLKTKVGPQKLTISKKYYTGATATVTVPITKQKGSYGVTLQATGRQVPLVVTNKLTGKAAENITVKASGTEVKTDKDGKVTIVVPADKQKLEGTLSGSGYNDTGITILVTETAVKENSFTITPAGKLYFLSKQSGKIDVVKTDLDGSNRQTVLAGTGKEEDRGTVLLASRDWKYLALLSRRDSDLAKLYLLETASDKLSVMDEGKATFSLSGWSDSTFVYSVVRNDKQYFDDKRQALKSFNAETKKLTTLTETANEQGAGVTYYQSLDNIFLAGNSVIYSVNVYSTAYNIPATAPALALGIYSTRPDGSDKKTLKSLSGALVNGVVQFPSISSSKPAPQEVEFTVNNTNSTTERFEWDHGTFKASTETYSDDEAYSTYLESPSGKATFWYEPRDGKNSLFVGDTEGENGKTVASLSDYIVYGWYTDNYLLVSKNGSELYILPASEDVDSAQVLKVSDYHKPNFSYAGYGGGYGGL